MRDDGRAASKVAMLPRWLVAGALMLGATCAAAQGTRIGYVNTARIESEAPQFVRAEAMKKEFQPREQQILELQKQIAAEQARFEKERDKLSPTENQSRRNAIANMMKKSELACRCSGRGPRPAQDRKKLEQRRSDSRDQGCRRSREIRPDPAAGDLCPARDRPYGPGG